MTRKKAPKPAVSVNVMADYEVFLSEIVGLLEKARRTSARVAAKSGKASPA